MTGNVEIGGVNLLLATQTWGSPWDRSGWTVESEKYLGLTVISKSTSRGDPRQDRISAKVGEMYAFSFYAKGTAGKPIMVMNSDTENNFEDISEPKNITFILENDWKRFIYTFKVIKDSTLRTRIEIPDENITAYICGVKMERGTVATDWTPAPEDLAMQSDYEALAARVAVLEAANA